MLKEINQSYPVLQCEMNLIASKEQLCLKTIMDRKGYAPVQSTPDETRQSCLMLQYEKGHLISSQEGTWLKNPSSTEKSMPRHNGHPIIKLSEMAMPQCKVIP